MSRLAHLDGIMPLCVRHIAADERIARDLASPFRVICRVTGRLLGAYPTPGGASACCALSMLDGIEPLIATHRVGKGE